MPPPHSLQAEEPALLTCRRRRSHGRWPWRRRWSRGAFGAALLPLALAKTAGGAGDASRGRRVGAAGATGPAGRRPHARGDTAAGAGGAGGGRRRAHCGGELARPQAAQVEALVAAAAVDAACGAVEAGRGRGGAGVLPRRGPGRRRPRLAAGSPRRRCTTTPEEEAAAAVLAPSSLSSSLLPSSILSAAAAPLPPKKPRRDREMC